MNRSNLIMKFYKRIFALVVIFVFVFPFPLWATPKIQEKKSQLEEVKKEIEEIDNRLDTVVEDYNEARYKLSRTQNSLKKVERSLEGNEKKLAQRRRALTLRVRRVYISGELSLLEMLLGARDLNEFIKSMKYASLLINYDGKLLREIKELKRENERKKAELEQKKKEEKYLVAKLAEKKETIESELGKRRKLYEKIKKEIASLEAAEARRQEELQRTYLASLNTNTQSSKSRRKISVSRSSYRVSRGSPRKDVVSIALAQLGKPYLWGAAGPNAFDCSGLVVYCFSQIGISLPHSSRALYNCGTPVSQSELQPGDLVFFARGGRINHVGIYVGNGNFIHSPHTGAVVRIQPLSSHGGYAGARRI